MRAVSPHVLRFGAFELDVTSRELTRSGRRLHLTPQAARLLLLLATRPGEIVTRDEIRRALWDEDTFVEFETAVNAAVSQIRGVLGDKATAPRFIETLPRRGYRFVAPVAGPATAVAGGPATPDIPQPEPVASSVRSLLPAASPPQRSIRFAWAAALTLAIAPLVATQWTTTIAPDAAAPTFAVLPIDAPADDVELTRVGNLLQEQTLVELDRRSVGTSGLLSRPAVETLRGRDRDLERVRQLGADFWIDATLQRVGDRARLHAKVARSADMRILWIDDFDVPPASLVSERDRFASELAQRLLESTGPHRAIPLPLDAGTPELILSGRLHLDGHHPASLSNAVDRLERAVGQTPADLAGRGLLSRALTRAALHARPPSEELIARAREHAIAVLRANPSNADALAALGGLQLWADWDLRAAGETLARAAAGENATTDGLRWYADWLSASGQTARAAAYARQIEARRPVSLAEPFVPRTLIFNREYDAALDALERLVVIEPDTPNAAWLRFVARELSGKADPAVRARLREQLEAAAADGNSNAKVGLAVLATLAGEHDRAVAWLTQAVDERAPAALFIKADPTLEPLAGRADYRHLVARVLGGAGSHSDPAR